MRRHCPIVDCGSVSDQPWFRFDDLSRFQIDSDDVSRRYCPIGRSRATL
jgi:hypothetical protein